MALEMDQLYEFYRAYVNRDLRFVKILHKGKAESPFDGERAMGKSDSGKYV